MRYAAFLRGINVGGRRVTGTQLCAPFEALGFEDVASFLASGNITFTVEGAVEGADVLEARIEAALHAALGFGVDVFVRGADEVAEVTGRRPFSAEAVAAGGGTPQVTFLRRTPTGDEIEEALVQATDEDQLAVVGREWYWLPSNGLSRSALDVRAIERALGRGTTRTTNTVARLHARFLAEPPG